MPSCGGSAALDTKAPTVTVVPFTHAFPVNGTVTFSGIATDDVGVMRIEILLDGATQKTCQFSPAVVSAGCDWSWDTNSSPDGHHRVDAKALDAAGNVGTDFEDVSVANVPR